MFSGPQTLPAKCLRTFFCLLQGKMSVVRAEKVSLAPDLLCSKPANIKSPPKENLLEYGVSSEIVHRNEKKHLNNIFLLP